MNKSNRKPGRGSNRSGFTLIELLLVIAIIAILSSLGLSIMAGAEENALRSRTNAQLVRISQILNQQLEENIYRVLPYRLAVGTDPQTARTFRKDLLAEFIRVEFPFIRDSINQTVMFPVGDPAGLGIQALLSSYRPQISVRYAALIDTGNNSKLPKLPALGGFPDWYLKDGDTNLDTVVDAVELEILDRTISAECLYAILSLHTDEQGQPLILLVASNEIADTDGDGVKEVLDAFGDPLLFRVLDSNGVQINPLTALDSTEYRVEVTSINTQGKL